MRTVLRTIVRFALSPLGALAYTGALAVMLLIAGADVHDKLFWLPVAIFLGVSMAYDISAYVAQRRKGLTSGQVADAVVERIWPTREEEGAR